MFLDDGKLGICFIGGFDFSFYFCGCFDKLELFYRFKNECKIGKIFIFRKFGDFREFILLKLNGWKFVNVCILVEWNIFRK